MNILYLCNEYTDDLIGGIGTVVKTEASALIKRGHKAFVVGTYLDTPEPPAYEKTEEGLTIIRWNSNDYRTTGIRLLAALAKLLLTLHLRFLAKRLETKKCRGMFKQTVRLVNDLVRREHIDLIEMPDYYDDFYRNPFIVPRKAFAAPVVIRVHGSVSFILHHSKGDVPKQILEADRSLFAMADGISAVSEFSKRFVTKYLSAPNQRVDVLYNPLEEHLFRHISNHGEPHTLLFIGKINEAKGVYSIIRAFNRLAEIHPDARLRIIGEGDIPRAQSMAKYPEQVHFTGYLHRDKVIEEIDNASFCVLPSYFENFSMAALEVLARKRALIYTNRASGAELIEDGVDGLLIDPDNTDQMAEKMELLLNDSDLRNRLAENGYTMCRRRFSTEVIIPQIEQYYQKIVNGDQ